jgi:hypothetical protein
MIFKTPSNGRVGPSECPGLPCDDISLNKLTKPAQGQAGACTMRAPSQTERGRRQGHTLPAVRKGIGAGRGRP